MLDAELAFECAAVFLVLGVGFVDGLGHGLAFLGILLQLSCQLYANLIRLPVFLTDGIDHVNHLVENLLDDGIA